MSHIQPQLLKIPLDEGDVVYTPDWVAADMVEHFNPAGTILEPCSGDGAFLRYLPNAEWCEIQQGKDFFQWHKQVDWIIGNPPYKMLADWLAHSFNLATNVCYLLPLNCIWNSMKRMRMVKEYGGVVEMRAYGEGSIFGLGYGFAVGAIHFQRNYTGLIKYEISNAYDNDVSKKGGEYEPTTE